MFVIFNEHINVHSCFLFSTGKYFKAMTMILAFYTSNASSNAERHSFLGDIYLMSLHVYCEK